MKILILSLATFLTVAGANAEVVKPADGFTPAEGSAIINNVYFSYFVEDRGWTASGRADKAGGKMEAVKSFLFNFEPVEQVKHDSQTIAALGVDVAQKCKELGQMEYVGQVKALTAGYRASLTAEIVNSLVQDDSTSFYARFVCLVRVQATK